MGSVINTGTPVQLWTNEYLSALATEAEIKISTDIPCIYVRFPLNIVLGQGVYSFNTDTPVPQRLTGIIRITWNGYTVHPVFQSQLRNTLAAFHPGNGDVTSSRPNMYMRTGYGIDGIKFFPAPNLSITYDNTDINTQTSIRSNVIVSGWRIADPTGSAYRIPDYIRETLVRYYVMSRAYKREGKGQNLEAAKYFEAKYNKLFERFKIIHSRLFASRTTVKLSTVGPNTTFKPPRPQLPSNFGIPCLPPGEGE